MGTLRLMAMLPALQRERDLTRWTQAAQALPYLELGYVPQGLTWGPQAAAALLAYYMPGGAQRGCPSILVAINLDSGETSPPLPLHEPDGTPYYGHAGGLCVQAGFLWVSAGNARGPSGRCLRFPFPSPSDWHAKRLLADAAFRPDSRASFLGEDEGSLWMGEFWREGAAAEKYPTANHHRCGAARGWAARYPMLVLATPAVPAPSLTGDRQVPPPTEVLWLPPECQGMAFHDGKVLLSLSFGSKDSQLQVHDPSRAPWQRTLLPDSQTVRGRLLDASTCVASVPLPAGTQDIGVRNNLLLVSSESCALPYRERWNRAGAWLDSNVRALDLSSIFGWPTSTC
ncbi:MAG: hypothetical protein M3Q75_09580 [Gemmatimonadota bacterium]|nr:hypothetical protein [Gemmatimonadota bacterium]